MKTFLTIILISIFVLNISCGTGGNTTGFKDDFTGVEGWYEVTPNRDTISPSLKRESMDGLLIIHHKFRTLEEAYKKWDWINNKIDYSTNLRKNLGEIDLDLHHYSVCCGNEKDFKCDNETIIRSVFKTSVTDAFPGKSRDLFYKVIAFDNCWNRSEPAMVASGKKFHKAWIITIVN